MGWQDQGDRADALPKEAISAKRAATNVQVEAYAGTSLWVMA
jgi:hypothetical protein